MTSKPNQNSQMAPSPKRTPPGTEASHERSDSSTETSRLEEDLAKALQQLQETKYQRAREQKEKLELKEQLENLLQEQAYAEEQLATWKAKSQEMKNLQDELNTLQEIRSELSLQSSYIINIAMNYPLKF